MTLEIAATTTKKVICDTIIYREREYARSSRGQRHLFTREDVPSLRNRAGCFIFYVREARRLYPCAAHMAHTINQVSRKFIVSSYVKTAHHEEVYCALTAHKTDVRTSLVHLHFFPTLRPLPRNFVSHELTQSAFPIHSHRLAH